VLLAVAPDALLHPRDLGRARGIINESAARLIGNGNVLGKTISFFGCDSIPMEIVGVVKDFNVHGFETGIQPVVYTIGNKACMFQSGGSLLVKLKSSQAKAAIADLTQVWKTIEPGFPIQYSFMDESFQQLFTTYFRLQKILGFFTAVAVFISAMGLFALTAFFSKQRTKEIGIRKVLGASVVNLSALLGKDFLRLVLLAIILTTPLAIWALNKWLETFVYRIRISWWMLLIASILIAAIAILTVSVQAIKAAVANPVKSLRNE